MLKLLFILVFATILNPSVTNASMPFYEDSEELRHCLRSTNDINTCAKEDALRTLNTIKKQYRAILTTPNIVGWHEDIQDNTTELRDMYESWTAFRNRLCSLSHKASMYLQKIVEEKISCNLYYDLHHKDHLDSIILLLRNDVPATKSDFGYLYIEDHDDEYSECMTKKQNEECITEELKRSTQTIKNLYKTMVEDEFIGKWNNGPDLKNGNYRDMYDSWIAYRNRMCSLSVWAYEKGYGKNALSLNQCLQFFNREILETLQNILVGAHSSLDDEYLNMDDDDGGEAEGKTIKPLEKRFDAKQSLADTLNPEDNIELPKENSQKTAPKPKFNLPAWAQ